VKQPRVRDNSPAAEHRVRFSPTVLPPYLRRSRSIDELIPWLYLKGISCGDFSEALAAILGADAPALSANVIVRLKEKWSQEYEAWSRRDLSQKHYVYFWADGIHVNVRLEDDANRRQCLLVLMGATSEGKKELVAVVEGYRESEQSWAELLLGKEKKGKRGHSEFRRHFVVEVVGRRCKDACMPRGAREGGRAGRGQAHFSGRHFSTNRIFRPKNVPVPGVPVPEPCWREAAGSRPLAAAPPPSAKRQPGLPR
jgi:hypothetical protein